MEQFIKISVRLIVFGSVSLVFQQKVIVFV